MDILTQDEADTLGVIEKYLIDPESVLIPPPQKTCIHYIRYRKDGQYYDNMKLSTFRSQKNSRKVSYRIIYDTHNILVRIDTQYAASHRNPDGKIIIPPYQPHIHIYTEGYNDKFAYPLPNCFSNADDIIQLFMEFLSYSNVLNADKISMVRQEVLFDDY